VTDSGQVCARLALWRVAGAARGAYHQAARPRAAPSAYLFGAIGLLPVMGHRAG